MIYAALVLEAVLACLVLVAAVKAKHPATLWGIIVACMACIIALWELA